MLLKLGVFSLAISLRRRVRTLLVDVDGILFGSCDVTQVVNNGTLHRLLLAISDVARIYLVSSNFLRFLFRRLWHPALLAAPKPYFILVL